MFNRQEIKNNQKTQYFLYFIMFLILFVTNIFTFFYATDLSGNLVMGFSYIILSLIVWLLPLLFLDIKNYFRLGLIFLLFSPIEIGFVKLTGLPINIGLMNAVLNTNFQEATEQLLSNLPALVFLFLLIIIYAFLLTLISKKKLPIKWKVGLLVVFLLINTVLFWKMCDLLQNVNPINQRLLIAYENTTKKYNKIYPANLVINLIFAIKAERDTKNFEKQIKSFHFNATQNSDKTKDEIYVLVIGETARRANFHLYGYPRETTPKLENIKDLVSFTNVNSAATLTDLSIPQIITRADPDNFERRFKEKTIIDLFHEAGFYTAWIGVQNLSIPIVQRLKSVADYTFFAKSDVSSSSIYDGDVLKNVQNIIDDKTHHKKFIIIHSLGSHFRYSNRYPLKFEKFKPNISRSGYSNIGFEYRKELVNSYDNSILYTDYFLSSVIKKINDANSVGGFIYLSDHGENLYDDGKTFSHGSEKPVHFVYQIPYLVWYSKKYKELYPNKVDAIYKNKDKKASSTVTFYSLADMANIIYKGSAKEKFKSILNEDYVEPVTRKLINSKKEVIIID